MFNPNSPTRYTGSSLHFANVVTRNRRPTTEDFMQPETGKYYVLFCGWQVGKNPTDGVEGELWMLSKIVGNVAYWVRVGDGSNAVLGLRGDDGVEVDPAVDGFIDLLGLVVPNGTNGQPVFTTSLAANSETIEVQVARSVAPTPGTSVDVGLSSFNSTQFNVDANGFVSLLGGGAAINGLGVQATSGGGTDPVVPNGLGVIEIEGAMVAAGTNPLRSVSTAANTLQIQSQFSQAIAATDATKVGLSNFNSVQFSVDGNGFVSLAGGGIAADSFAMQTGTSPVVPDGNGLVTFNGSSVAAGTNPVRTNGTGANTMQLEVQTTQAIAATDATKIGLAAFDSMDFSVDGNGFVTLTGSTPDISTVSEQFDDFIWVRPEAGGDTFSGDFNWKTASTTAWSHTNESNHPGVFNWAGTTTSNSLASSNGDAAAGVEVGFYEITVEFMVKTGVLSAADPNYQLCLGLNSSQTEDPDTAGTSGMYFLYNHSVNSGKWTINNRNGASVTSANTNNTVDTDWHRYKIVINAAGTSVAFFIDDVEVDNSPLTTDIFGDQLMMLNAIKRIAGSTAKDLNIDYWYSKMVFSR